MGLLYLILFVLFMILIFKFLIFLFPIILIGIIAYYIYSVFFKKPKYNGQYYQYYEPNREETQSNPNIIDAEYNEKVED